MNDIDRSNAGVVIRATCESKGFDRPTWGNLLSKAMLVVTELDEARAAVLPGGQGNLAEELADTWIRLVDMLEAIWPAQWWARRAGLVQPTTYQPIEVALWPIVACVSDACERWRKLPDGHVAVRIGLELSVGAVEDAARALGCDLDAAIKAKMVKNAGRPPLHGKVQSA